MGHNPHKAVQSPGWGNAPGTVPAGAGIGCNPPKAVHLHTPPHACAPRAPFRHISGPVLSCPAQLLLWNPSLPVRCHNTDLSLARSHCEGPRRDVHKLHILAMKLRAPPCRLLLHPATITGRDGREQPRGGNHRRLQYTCVPSSAPSLLEVLPSYGCLYVPALIRASKHRGPVCAQRRAVCAHR